MCAGIVQFCPKWPSCPPSPRGRGLGEGERHSNLGFTHLTQDWSGRTTKLTSEPEHRRVTRTSEDSARSGTEKVPVGGFDARRKICAARTGKGPARKVAGSRDARPGVGFLRSPPALSRSGRGFENRPWIVLPPQRNLGRNPVGSPAFRRFWPHFPPGRVNAQLQTKHLRHLAPSYALNRNDAVAGAPPSRRLTASAVREGD